MRHMLGNLSPNYFERTKRYMMLRASRQGTDLTVSGTPPLSLPNSLGKPLKAWSVDVLPYQEGTGDPAPDNVRPIYGTDKVTVWTAGSNLFANDLNEIRAVQYYTTDPNVVSTRYGYEIYLPAGTYTISAEFIDTPTSIYIYGAVYKPDGQRVGSQKNLVSGTSITAQTLVIGEGEKVMYYDGASSDALVNAKDKFSKIRIMINVGSTALPYEPYVGSSSVLTLPQTVYTGTIGSEGGESRWGKVDLGTLNYVHYESLNRHLFRAEPIESLKGSVSQSTPVNALCEAFKPLAYNSTWVDGSFSYAYGMEGTNQLVFINNQYSDPTVFKTAMTGIKLVYELANPSTFAVTAPTIPTPTGTATTWATAEDGTVESMEVTYVGKA